MVKPIQDVLEHVMQIQANIYYFTVCVCVRVFVFVHVKREKEIKNKSI